MIRISLDQLEPNTVIKQDIYDQHFNVIVKKDSAISLKMILAIKNYGYQAVYIDNEFHSIIPKVSVPLEQLDALNKILKKLYLEMDLYLKKEIQIRL